MYNNKFTRLFLNDYFILLLIVVNALIIFAQEFPGIPLWLTYMDNVFTLFFTTEMVVKVRTYGFRNYWNVGWNKLDFILVMLSLLSLLQLIGGNEYLPLNFLMTIRVFRVFKSFRLIRFVPNVDEIINGVQRAIKAS